MSFEPDISIRIVVTVLILLVWAGGIGGFLCLIHFLLTLPMRRAERARLFLDLVETALNHGQPIEEALVSISQSRDWTMGARFHLLAAWLEKGLRLGEALVKVPGFLSPQVGAMLRAGERLGDLRKVLSACRQLVPDALSHVRSALNYMLVMATVTVPGVALISFTLTVYMVPRLNEIAQGIEAPLPAWTRLVFGAQPFVIGLEVGTLFFLLLATLAYIGGPRLAAWLRWRRFPVVDWLAWRLPWRRKRLQRDFSAMLAILLDAEVPEPEAVILAADCTANAIFKHRAGRAADSLKQGLKLTEAVQVMDDTGEFRWRLTNACHAHTGFLQALAGWHESLDAKAFQQEQAVAHGVTTALVLLNGLFVGAIAIAVFLFLVSVVNTGVLW